jgi:tetratricopeptide (TPR) repeat protein
MADTGTGWRKHKRALMIAGMVLVLVLAAAAGVGLRQLQKKEVAVPANPTPALPKVVDDLQNLRDKGDEAAFNAALQAALYNSLDDETRYMVHVQEGHYGMQTQQWQAAIDAYSKAMAIAEDKEVAALLGDAYAALGNKAKAIEYYEKAIRLIPADHPNRAGLQEEYQLRIQMVEEGARP